MSRSVSSRYPDPLPCAPRYGMSLTCPAYQRRLLRNICLLGENARLSLKRDSYADFSLCANVPCLLGSVSLISWLSRLSLKSHRRSTHTVSCAPSADGGLFIPHLKDLILTHIFLGRLEKPITMDVLVKQSTVAPGLSSCFTQLNCKMWVKDRLKRWGLSSPFSIMWL